MLLLSLIHISKEGDSVLIAENAVKDGFTELIAVGGDGTINEVGDVVVKNNLKLGVIPAGTGNDYMNSLGAVSYTHLDVYKRQQKT